MCVCVWIRTEKPAKKPTQWTQFTTDSVRHTCEPVALSSSHFGNKNKKIKEIFRASQKSGNTDFAAIVIKKNLQKRKQKSKEMGEKNGT